MVGGSIGGPRASLVAAGASGPGTQPDRLPEQPGQAAVGVDAAVGLAGRTVRRLAFAVVDRRQRGPTDEARLPVALVDAKVRSAIRPRLLQVVVLAGADNTVGQTATQRLVERHNLLQGQPRG